MRMPLNDIFNQVQSDDHFDAIRIGLASPGEDPLLVIR
jgi:DNA-directed RNA polymerase subunit beta'